MTFSLHKHITENIKEISTRKNSFNLYRTNLHLYVIFFLLKNNGTFTVCINIIV
jgi:hypothetical protein